MVRLRFRHTVKLGEYIILRGERAITLPTMVVVIVIRVFHVPHDSHDQWFGHLNAGQQHDVLSGSIGAAEAVYALVEEFQIPTAE